VTSARLPRILTAIAADGPPRAGQLCTIAAQIVEVDGAGVMIEGADQRAPLCSSDDIADRAEGLSVADALVRLRGHAYAEGRTLVPR